MKNITLACALVAFTLPATRLPAESVAEFDRKEVESIGWSVVVDGVMGGLSRGRMEVTEDGVLQFRGTLSLENNGGFSSIRTDTVERDLSAAEGVRLRIKGDGRTYQVRFNTDARYRGMEVSFMADFPTVKNEWTEVKVPFASFTGSFRGRQLDDEKFDPAKIRRMGLMLADNKPGDFELHVDWIRTYGGKDGVPDLVATALADGRFGILAKALTTAELVGVLQGEGPFTVFAPTDEAFAKLPEATIQALLKPEGREQLRAILLYHVLPGTTDLVGALKAGKATTVLGEPVTIGFANGRVRVNDAAILDADILCSNGVIHVIDSVILPPDPPNDLVGVAKRAGVFGTLLAAVDAAGLTDALTGDGPLTLFAPTDEAFSKLPKGTVETLLKPENRSQLQEILKLHAVAGKVSAGDALNAGKAEALNGGALRFGIEDGRFQVNGATILKTDIGADNGVIHVIDAVLLPPAKSEPAEKPTALGPMDRIEAAIAKGVPVFNSGDHRQCAAIYRDCMIALAEDESLEIEVHRAVRQLVARARGIESDTERAWLLRAGLDHIHAALTGR